MNGNLVMWVGIHTNEGGPSIQMRDLQGNRRFAAVIDADGNPSLQLLAADGEVLWSAP
jgi:hypothetical protein